MDILRRNGQRLRLLVLGLALVGLASSCSTPLREITYMHWVQTNAVQESTPLPDAYRIRPNDHLYIRVIGDDPQTTAFLNLNVGTQTSVTSSSTELITFTVDEQGAIWYPQLGEMKVEGLTVTELRDQIQEKVDHYIEGTSVQVKLVNRTITVLGEVRSPGMQQMTKNHLTIFEALGTAGDITDWGNRRNVKLVRETPEGRQVVELNLTAPDLVTSDYYYILPHDVIYVEPDKRVYGFKTLPFMSQVGLAPTTLSTIVLILNLLK